MSLRLYYGEHCVEDVETLEYLTMIFNTLSILSILFVFFIYYYTPHIRTFDFRMVIYLQISDFIWSAGLLATEGARKNKTLCRAQSFFVSYASLCSIFWTILISKSIYDSLKGNIVISKKMESILLIISFVAPGFIAFMYKYIFLLVFNINFKKYKTFFFRCIWVFDLLVLDKRR